MYRLNKLLVVLLTTATTGFVGIAQGQSLWTDQSGDRSVSLEFLRPQFDGESYTDFLTSVAYLSGRFPIGQNMTGEVEIPIARYGSDSDFVDRSETAIGNLYIGFRADQGNVVTQIGVRLPTAPSDKWSALGIGSVSDFDRFDGYLPDVATLLATFTKPTKISDNVTVHFGAGPVLSILTKDTGGDNVELFAKYFLLTQFDGSGVCVKAGLTGRAIVTEGDLDFGERTIHQLGIGASLNSGTVRPGLHVRLPLDDDLSRGLDYVAGLNITFILD